MNFPLQFVLFNYRIYKFLNITVFYYALLFHRYLRKVGAGLPPHLGHAGLNVVMHTDGATRPPEVETMQSRPVLIPDKPSYCQKFRQLFLFLYKQFIFMLFALGKVISCFDNKNSFLCYTNIMLNDGSQQICYLLKQIYILILNDLVLYTFTCS